MGFFSLKIFRILSSNVNKGVCLYIQPEQYPSLVENMLEHYTNQMEPEGIHKSWNQC